MPVLAVSNHHISMIFFPPLQAGTLIRAGASPSCKAFNAIKRLPNESNACLAATCKIAFIPQGACFACKCFSSYQLIGISSRKLNTSLFPK